MPHDSLPCDGLNQNTYEIGHENLDEYHDKLCIEKVESDMFYLFLMEALYKQLLHFCNMHLDSFVWAVKHFHIHYILFDDC